MYKIPIAQPDINDQFTFKLRNLEFHADIILFACFSELFQEDISLIEQKEYTVKSNVSKESFQDFLGGCQGKAFFIKSSNAYDLDLLCQEFKTSLFNDKIKEFFDKNRDEALIEKLKYYLLDDNSSKDEEALKEITQQISLRLDYMSESVKRDLFTMKLSNEIIEKFLEIPDRNFKFDSLFFASILKNDETSNLFSHIDLKSLSLDEVQRFATSNSLPQYYESRRVFPFLADLINLVKQQRDKINELQQMVQNNIIGINNKINDMDETASQMVDEIRGCTEAIGEMANDLKHFDLKAAEIKGEIGNLNKKIEKIDAEKYFPLQSKFDKLEEKIIRSVIINNPLDGIFHSLYSRNDTNPAGIDVKIITPAPVNSDFAPSNLLEYDNDTIDDCYYHKIRDKKTSSKNDPIKTEVNENNCNNWIEFEFVDSRVKLIGYTIRTNCFGESFSHPKHFIIQGCNDGETWEKIDERKDAIELNGARILQTYILKEYSPPYQKIRFLQLDSHSNYKDKDKIMALSAIELHGEREYLK